MTNMINLKKAIALIGIIVCCTACHQKVDYLVQLNENIPDMQWLYNQPASFSFSIADTSHPYTLGFCIRYNNNYPDANIYLFVHTCFPNGNQSCDTVSIDLFQPDGTPTGIGKHVQELNVNISKINFPQAGNYRMEIEQATRHDTIEGIASMGIYLINEPTLFQYGTKEENN